MLYQLRLAWVFDRAIFTRTICARALRCFECGVEVRGITVSATVDHEGWDEALYSAHQYDRYSEPPEDYDDALNG